MASSIDRIEYEGMLFGRHLTTLPAGRSRRRGGLLDPSAYVLLSLLEAGGPSTIAELTAATGLDASTLNRQTAALRKAELAERFEDPEGGQARKLRLSAHGQRLLDEERRASRDSLAELVDDWSEEDRSQFAELLARCNRALEDRSGRYWPRP